MVSKPFWRKQNRFPGKRLLQLLVAVLCVSLIMAGCIGQTVFANDGSVETTFFGNLKDEGNGCGVYLILNYTIDFLAFGVGIAAIIGIVVFGITYMTAGDNQNKVIKAKRRIYEIVIGLAVYVTLWSLLSFFLPGGVLNSLTDAPKCGRGTASNSFFTEPDEVSPLGSQYQDISGTRRPGKNTPTLSNSTTNSGTNGDIAASATNIANIFINNHYSYSQNGGVTSLSKAKKTKYGKANCATFVSLVYQDAGLLKDGQRFYFDKTKVNAGAKRMLEKNNFKVIKTNGAPLKKLVQAGVLTPGDAVGLSTQTHTMIYGGRDNNGKYFFHNGGSAATSRVGGKRVYKKLSKFITNYGCGSGNCRVGIIAHINK